MIPTKILKHMLDTVPEIQSIPPEFILPVEKRPSSVHQGWILVIELGGLDGSNSERMLVWNRTGAHPSTKRCEMAYWVAYGRIPSSSAYGIVLFSSLTPSHLACVLQQKGPKRVGALCLTCQLLKVHFKAMLSVKKSNDQAAKQLANIWNCAFLFIDTFPLGLRFAAERGPKRVGALCLTCQLLKVHFKVICEEIKRPGSKTAGKVGSEQAYEASKCLLRFYNHTYGIVLFSSLTPSHLACVLQQKGPKRVGALYLTCQLLKVHFKARERIHPRSSGPSVKCLLERLETKSNFVKCDLGPTFSESSLESPTPGTTHGFQS
ncbi:hypothetical protein CKAN_02006100 [Cinnamomum micranthum f. kanehirae]|uniref:Uncharacterized protein n=1 Tax=Cinnamomum micranthum f. kanehirae TaxID=337451 RepID=A0A443PJJ6_9MAGN|nr:hypothetical protein CKAN_02006100 [Cinnamomum micranthum f. kanehirae]